MFTALHRNFKNNRARVKIILSVLALLFAAVGPAMPAHAAQITSRKVTLSSSAPSATSTSYTFNFTLPTTGTAVKSLDIIMCTTASNPCSGSTPTGLTTTGASLTSQPTNLGAASGWTGTFSTNGRLQIANSGNSTNPSGSQTLVFGGITNPSTANTAFYARIVTYSDASWTTVIDTGIVAAAIANQITVSATVPESLTFCTGTSGITSSSCAGATGTSVSLGVLTTTSTGVGTSQIGVTTNASLGYAITVNGSTLTSGSNTIAALASPTASAQGSAQFGINLKSNTTPTVGSDPAGAGSAAPTSNYNTANSFTFNTGDQIATVGTFDNFRLFTVSYIANITSVTPPGTYSTTLTYICTATF
ncbi:MAG TPA: hypothetical protein VJR27_02995 [Candidatus Saccharimonadales bacterium]|nr:hypothetical protein [Candidatus Saccharimonadales bacterium]